MAEILTLTEAAKLSENDLVAGVILNIANFDPVLHGGGGFNPDTQRPLGLPFLSTDNQTYEFNRENSRGSAVWFDPDEEITGEAATFTNATATLKSIARQFDIPKFTSKSHSGTQSQSAIQMRAALRGMADEFMTGFWYGLNSSNSKIADGFVASIDSTMKTAESDGALNLSNLDIQLQDKMKFGTDMMVTCRTIKRLFATAARGTAVTGYVVWTPDQIGRRVMMYDDTPIFASDFITTTEEWSTATFTSSTGGTTASSIYQLKFGEDMSHGVTLGAGPYVEYFDKMERKDSERWRIVWHVLPYVRKSLWAAGGVVNISTADAIAA